MASCCADNCNSERPRRMGKRGRGGPGKSDGRQRRVPRTTEGRQARRAREFSGEMKAKIALEALPGDKTIRETAARHQDCPNRAGARKRWASVFRVGGVVSGYGSGSYRLSKWYRAEAEERGLEVSYDDACESVHGLTYSEWKSGHRAEPTPEQLAAFGKGTPPPLARARPSGEQGGPEPRRRSDRHGSRHTGTQVLPSPDSRRSRLRRSDLGRHRGPRSPCRAAPPVAPLPASEADGPPP